MPKFSKETIIGLYKRPNSLNAMEIWAKSDYFTSITKIRAVIKEAIASGEITEEDEAVFEERKKAEEREKEDRNKKLKSIILTNFSTGISRREIAEKIEKETGIKTNATEIGKLIEDLRQTGYITEEAYKESLRRVRENAVKKSISTLEAKRRKQKQEKGLEL